MSQAAKLPGAVRRQVRAAEREYEKAYGKKDGAPGEPGGEASSRVVDLALQDPQQPLAKPAAQDAPPPGGPAEPAVQDAPPPPAEAPPAPAAQEPQGEDWEQKYRSLQGIINQREAEIRGLHGTLAALTDIRREHRDNAAPPAAPESAPPAERARRLKQEDVQTYGEDYLRFVKDAAYDVVADEFAPEINKLRAENAELRQQLGGVEKRTVQSEAARTEAFLDQHVPTWRTVNVDPDFLNWLQQTDPFTGATRQSLLQKANDGPRVAAFFQAYLTESQAIRSPQGSTPDTRQAEQPQPPTQGHEPTVDRASLVAPGRPTAQGGGAGAATTGGETQIVTDKQISAFYRDVQMGKYKSNPKEKDRIERIIADAVATGRVVQGKQYQ